MTRTEIVFAEAKLHAASERALAADNRDLATAAAEVGAAAAALVIALERRNTAVRAMRSEGASLRQIAKAAGLSPQGVVRILDRS